LKRGIDRFSSDILVFLIDQEKEAAKELEGVPDDEGWIKVTRLSRNTASRTQSNDKRTKRKLKKRNREKVQKLISLYLLILLYSSIPGVHRVQKKCQHIFGSNFVSSWPFFLILSPANL